MRIYRLDVVPIPPHRPMVRDDHPDFVFKSADAKWRAIADDIEATHSDGRPILVGTTSIEVSEMLSGMLQKRGVAHQVLNAKNHEREASIIAHAGGRGAVTVATNMAGRGTDIILGGNPDSALEDELRKSGYTTPESAPDDVLEKLRATVQERWREEHEKVVAMEGLFVLGTEKHEARRIDNQLRGRSGRQGDPGESRFYVSLEDDLMRRFGGDRIKGFMNLMGIAEDQPLEAGVVTKALGTVQTKVEAHNFEIRKNLVEYDDVINRHREVIYAERRKVLDGGDLKANVLSMVERELDDILDAFVVGADPEEWDLEGLGKELRVIFPLPPALEEGELELLSGDEIHDRVQAYSMELYEEHETAIGSEAMRGLERLVMLRTIDAHWVQHLTMMENLRQGVGLQAYGQRDPLVAYRAQGHEQFQTMLETIQHDIAHTIYHVGLAPQPAVDATRRGVSLRTVRSSPMVAMAHRPHAVAVGGGAAKVGRNAPCPCGSGKKYKKCHGVAA
jgi:preprotein translocase subunit SecA